MINEFEIRKHLKKALPITVLDVTDSTNSEARRLAESGNFGETLIIAKRQTTGRGRLGRSFYSEDGGLYMSLLLKPDLTPEAVTRVTTAAAVSVVRAVTVVTGIETGIKWVNDIFLNGRKICGILTEGKALSSGKLEYAVLGIGINLTAPQGGFPAEISQTAGALFGEIPAGVADRLAAGIINEFYRIYENGLNPADYIDDYRKFSCIIGKEVTVTKIIDGEKKVATVLSIDGDFRLSVRYADGSEDILSTGEITMHS